ncbi:glycosyltransferase [Paracoccaceae bacterium GXU_MW_L88]
MRITLAIEGLAQSSGGAERVIINLANALQERGHEVDLVTYERKDGPPHYPVKPGISLTNLRPRDADRSGGRRALDKIRKALHTASWLPPGLSKLAWWSKYEGFRGALEAHVTTHGSDAVVAFKTAAIIALAGVETPQPLRKIGSLRNSPAQDLGKLRRRETSAYATSARIAALEKMDEIALLMPQFKDMMPAHLRPKVRIVQNWLDLDRFRPGPEARENLILCMGRLAPQKRQDLAIRAFAKADLPNWRMEIYGEGNDEAMLRDLITELDLADRVALMGYNTDPAPIYQRAAILIHPAASEGFVNAVAEALACGVPVVGFAACSGVNDHVGTGRNGLLVGDREAIPSDAAATPLLAEALKAIATDGALAASLSQNAVQSMQKFERDHIVDQWIACIEGR